MKKTFNIEFLKSQRGITLIALVVTIIVFLILAGVSIRLLSGGDGILKKATNAVETSNEEKAQEQVKLKLAEFQTEYYDEMYVKKNISVNTEMGDWIAENKTGEINTEDYTFTITGSSPYTVTIKKDNTLKKDIVGSLGEDGKLAWASSGSGSEGTTPGDPDTPENPGGGTPGEPETPTWSWTDSDSSGTKNIGDVVTHSSGEKFNIISTEGANYSLLAANCINTNTLLQGDDANRIKFSNTNYWSSVTSYPVNLNTYESASIKSTDAIEYAKAYGIAKGGTGRLITYEEVNTLKSSYSSMIFGKETTAGYLVYWIGSAADSERVWIAHGGGNLLMNYYCNDDNGLYMVRPVVEIDKSLIQSESGSEGTTPGDPDTPENPGGGTPEEPETPRIPEVLGVGSEVTYTPSGIYTEWTSAHSGDSSYNYSLASGSSYTDSRTQTDMTITNWKVFKIDEETGEVQLVPSNPTTNSVGLKDATGYNNAVKLLNEACSSLYGNSSKNITARSINMEDIESVLDYDPTTYNNSYATYGQQYSSAYTSNNKYPTIYAEEKESVITPAPKGKTKTLGRSDAASNWILGYTTAGTSIQPYQTFYYLNNSDFSSKLKTEENGIKYSDLLLPNTTSTEYWVASRCVNLGSSYCLFNVRRVYSGDLGAGGMFASYDGAISGASGSARPMFPVVSLSSELIEGDASVGFSVK